MNYITNDNKLILFDIYDYKTCICLSELISNYIGIKIHHDYDIQNNTKYQKYIRNLDKNKKYNIIKTLSNNYKNKYSKLSLIKKEDNQTNYDILMGVCSKFNEYDIIFYCNEWLNNIMIDKYKHQLYNDIVNIFENYFSINFGYRISPFTLNYVNEHFNIINKKDLKEEVKKLYI
jgi:hypothetical protein